VLNTNLVFFFVLDLAYKEQIFFWDFPSYGLPSRGQNQTVPSDSSSPSRKTPKNFSNWLKFGSRGVFRDEELESEGIV
jgi:hypothetical protein